MTYKIRLRLAKIILPLAVAGFFALSFESCTSSYASNAGKKTFSGEDIFKAIYFNEGEAARLLPALSNAGATADEFLTEAQLAQKHGLMTEVVDAIKVMDKDYFEKFKKTIAADDYNEISAALKESADMFVKAGLQSEKYGSSFKAAFALAQKMDAAGTGIKEGQPAKAGLRDMNTDKPKDFNVEGRCLAIAVVVAAVVLETVALVNSIAGVTSIAYAFAVAWTKGAVYSYENNAGEMGNQKVVYQLANNF
jgi:SdpC family antimicrobial peptide